MSKPIVLTDREASLVLSNPGEYHAAINTPVTRAGTRRGDAVWAIAPLDHNPDDIASCIVVKPRGGRS